MPKSPSPLLPTEETVYFVHWHDISEQKRKEQQLRESEAKFAATFLKSGVPSAITTIREGRIVDVNEAASNALGWSRDDLLGMTSTDIAYIASEQRTMLLNLIEEKGKAENLELEVKTKDGEIRYGLF